MYIYISSLIFRKESNEEGDLFCMIFMIFTFTYILTLYITDTYNSFVYYWTSAHAVNISE